MRRIAPIAIAPMARGSPATFPALNKNPFVLGDPQPVIATVLNGRKGDSGADAHLEG